MRAGLGLGIAGFGAASALFAPAQAEASTWRFHADHVLGTSLDLAVMAHTPLAAALAMSAVRTEINRLDTLLSTWRKDSELSLLNAATSLRVSHDLFAVLSAAERWRKITGGAYSARIGRLLQDVRADADLAVRIANADLRLDPRTRTVTRPDTVIFAVDGLAKGYIVDRALAAARRVSGVTGMMVDIGGDLKCWGNSPAGEGWRIGLIDPLDASDSAPSRAHLLLNNQAAATSGRSSRRQATISPITGQIADHVVYATVTADSAADADALATAFSVLPPHESLKLADRLPNVATRVIAANGEQFTSSRWRDFRASNPGRIVPAADIQTENPWPAGFSLGIEYEVPKIATSGYHNPYVAIWITDEKKALVRTLLVLGKEPRYREENYIYWRRFGRLNAQLVDSVSRPTRAPGHYTLNWDGLDDTGKKVPQGKYTVTVEASRERGGHSTQRLDLTLGADGVSAETQPDGEIGRVRASYGRPA